MARPAALIAPRAVVDFETRSELPIKGKDGVGAWRYAEHHSTEIICLGYRLPGEDVKVWTPDQRFTQELIDFYTNGGTLEAHNAQFERAIWYHVLLKRRHIPMPSRWVDTLASCAYRSLPLALDKVGDVVSLSTKKDKRGSYLLDQLSKPRRPLKADKKRFEAEGLTPDQWPVLWRTKEEFPELYQETYDYCAQDVRTEEALSEMIGDLPDPEYRIWVLDQVINQRGVQIDLEAVHAAQWVVETTVERLAAELQEITGGAVQTGKQVAAMREWLEANNVFIPDLKADTVDDFLKLKWVEGPCRRVLEIRQQLSSSSVSKLSKFLATVNDDGRIRGTLQYYGAGTGRWCLTGDHEVLTPNGWVRLDEWQGGDIACWNENEQVSFQESEALSFPYTGELIHLSNKRVDQLSTPEHKMPTWDVKTTKFDVKEVKDLNRRVKLPYTGTRTFTPSIDNDQLRILVMTQADGHYAQDGQLRFRFKKDRKVQRCKMLLRRAGIVFSVAEYSDGSTTLTIRYRHLPMFLRMFREKVFGWWLLDCDPTIVFEELEQWDGYRAGPNSVQYSSVVKQNVDVLQALAHTSGLAACVTVKTHDEENWNDSHILNVWLNPSNRNEYRPDKERTTEEFDGWVYCAETKTGFFLVRRNGKVWVTGNSGRGIQPQNFPRGIEELDIDVLIEAIKNRDLECLTLLAGDPMEAIASSLRGMIIAAPGKILRVADFSAIEAVVLAWLAGEDWLIEAFSAIARGEKYNGFDDMYCATASMVLGRFVTKKDKTDRQVGKTCTLAFGYVGGIGAWRNFDRSDTYNDEQVEHFKKSWREKHPSITSLWWALDDAAVKAIRHKGQTFSYRNLAFRCISDKAGQWLQMILPNGRILWYFNPQIEMIDKWGNGKLSAQVLYEGRDNKRGGAWGICRGYAGIWTENAVQAISRDLMVEAMVRVEAAGYPIVLTVHDELVCEVDEDHGNQEEFLDLMINPIPPWAEGCPVGAAGEAMYRYRK